MATARTTTRGFVLGATLCAGLSALVAFAPAAHAGEAAVIAKPDTVTTPENHAVEFDPTANDQIAANCDVTKIEVESNPDHGTAAIIGTHTIRYTPDSGYSGPDAMMYNVFVLCGGEVTRSDTGDISITVTPTPTTTTTVAPTTTTATVAPLATTVPTTAATTTTVAAALPRTGSTSGPLAFVAALTIGAGAMLLAFARRRRRAGA